MSDAPSAPLPPSSLGHADWLSCAPAQAVFAALQTGGAEARAVGGAVRNTLLGRPVGDVDIATTARPEEVIRLAKNAGLGAVPTGIEHGTVTVVSAHRPYEVTTLRRDIATDGRHATIEYTADWAADASRRDFTINALYCDAGGRLFDPLDGYPDILARRVRFIGDARQRIREDVLRILRFFRFHAAFGEGDADPTGLRACVAERAGMARLSGERVRAELLKLLAAPRAVAAITAMFEHGLLVDVLAAVPWPQRLQQLAALEAGLGRAPDPLLRLSVLAIAVDEDRLRLAGRLRLSHAERDALIVPEPGTVSRDFGDRAARLRLYQLGPDNWARHVLGAWSASRCDASDPVWRNLLALPGSWPPPRLPVRGADVLALGVPPGPHVGTILADFERWWSKSDFPMDDHTVRLKLAELVATAQRVS